MAVECGGREAKSNLLRAAFTEPEDRNDDGLFDTKGGQGRGPRLVTDPSQDTFDRYGRLLAYVTTRQGTELSDGRPLEHVDLSLDPPFGSAGFVRA